MSRAKEMTEHTTFLLPEDRQRELRKFEDELLYCEDKKKKVHYPRSKPLPTLFGITDSAAFLLGYLLLAIGANIYMAAEYAGGTVYFYIINAAFSAIGLIGLITLHPTSMFIYGAYLCASFIFSAGISGGLILFVLQSDVCNVIGDILPGNKLKRLCLENPTKFQMMTVGSVMAELFLEVFVMWQLKKMYDYAIDSPAEDSKNPELPKGKLGSIAILKS